MIPLIIIAIQFISRHFFPIFHGTTSFPFFISSFLQIHMNMHGMATTTIWMNTSFSRVCEERGRWSEEKQQEQHRQTDRPSVSSAIMPA